MELMKLQSDHNPGNCRAALAGVVRFYETLAPDTLDQLAGLYAADARFKDPFNDVVGIAAITGIFRHMSQPSRRPASRSPPASSPAARPCSAGTSTSACAAARW